MYRSHVLVCGGTGCTSSGSETLISLLQEELKKNGLENEVAIVKTGCHGLCEEGPIMVVYPEAVFYSRARPEDIPEIVSKLAGGFLVIEDANQLSQETAAELEEVMNGNTKGMIVILEDEKIGMRKLIARYPKLAKKFTSMINIPVFTNDELVNFAKVYTMENGFRIDQMGMLALYNLIGINQKEDQPMCIGTVKKMLDDAMTRAQSGLFKRSKKRVDRDGYTVLLEKDFS